MHETEKSAAVSTGRKLLIAVGCLFLIASLAAVPFVLRLFLEGDSFPSGLWFIFAPLLVTLGLLPVPGIVALAAAVKPKSSSIAVAFGVAGIVLAVSLLLYASSIPHLAAALPAAVIYTCVAVYARREYRRTVQGSDGGGCSDENGGNDDNGEYGAASCDEKVGAESREGAVGHRAVRAAFALLGAAFCIALVLGCMQVASGIHGNPVSDQRLTRELAAAYGTEMSLLDSSRELRGSGAFDRYYVYDWLFEAADGTEFHVVYDSYWWEFGYRCGYAAEWSKAHRSQRVESAQAAFPTLEVFAGDTDRERASGDSSDSDENTISIYVNSPDDLEEAARCVLFLEDSGAPYPGPDAKLLGGRLRDFGTGDCDVYLRSYTDKPLLNAESSSVVNRFYVYHSCAGPGIILGERDEAPLRDVSASEISNLMVEGYEFLKQTEEP